MTARAGKATRMPVAVTPFGNETCRTSRAVSTRSWSDGFQSVGSPSPSIPNRRGLRLTQNRRVVHRNFYFRWVKELRLVKASVQRSCK